MLNRIKKSVRKIMPRRKGYRRKDFAHIGRHTKVNPDACLVPRNMWLDDYVMIQNLVNFISFRGKVVVKKYSVISSGCTIVPSTHLAAPGVPFYFQAKDHCGDEDHTITVNEDCWVGANSILLPKCSLGRGCVVAAGSVVTREFPPYAVIAGAPARIIGVKFSRADVEKHEAMIYPPSERMSAQELDKLFSTFYAGMKPMKKCPQQEIDAYLATRPYTINEHH